MRIALVATHHVDYVANLARALAKTHEVMLIVSRRSAARQLRPESLELLARQMRVHVVPHHLAPLQPWIALLCLRHIRRFAPDVVHVQEHPTRSMGMLAKWLGGLVAFVTTVHDPEPHSGNDAAAANVFTRYYAELRLRSDALIVHGEKLVDVLAGTGVDRRKIAAIPHGVLHFGRHDGDAASTGIAVDRRRLIFFGRMEAYKGLDTLLAAHEIWRREKVDIRLTVAGAGPEIARHREALAAPGIDLHAGRVAQAELECMVMGCAAAILPYHDATQSGVVASTFGAGRPAIVTDVGELAAAVLPDAGMVVPPRDPVALAEAGRRLVEEAGLLDRLERGVRSRTEGELGWDSIARKTEELYRAAIARHDQ